MKDMDQGLSNTRILFDALRNFRGAFGRFLSLEILFKFIAVALSGPLSALFLSLVASFTGHLVVGNEELLSVFLSPAGIGLVLLWGVVALVTVLSEQAGPMIIASEARFRRKVTSVETLLLTARKMPALFNLGLIQVFACSLLVVPCFVLIGLSYSLLLSGQDINHLLTAKPPAFWAALAIAILLLLGLLVAVATLHIRWIFALPACLFGRKRFLSALRESQHLVKGSFFRLARILLLWDVLMAAAFVATVSLFDLLREKLLAHLGERMVVVIPALAGFAGLFLITIEVVFFFGFTIHCVLVTHLFHDAVMRKGWALPDRGMRSHRADPDERRRQLSLKRRIWIGAACFLLMTATLSVLIVEQLDLEDRVEITAHRGSSKRAPENTLSAIEKAMEDRADLAEIDVQMTGDGVIVLFHDQDLMRVAGINKKIEEATYEELREVDAGSWFSPEFKGERIPTLTQAIEVAGGRIRLNIEVKATGEEQTLVQKVVQILQENQFTSQCIITSLDYDALQRAKSLDGNIEVGYVIFESLGRILQLDVEYLNVRSGLITQGLIKAAHKARKRINAWTVNDPEKMADLLDLGVDGIITDYPEKLTALLEERAALSDVERLFLRFRSWMRRKRSPDALSASLRTWFRIWLPPQGHS